MSDKRMFSKQIVESDAFLDMPLSTQALYFHLGMAADDDGFINAPKRIQRSIGASDDDLKLLMAKNFIIPFESGVVVIKHWKINNYIRADRKRETAYLEEMSKLVIKENGSYRLATDRQVTGKCPSSGSIDKYRLDKNRLDKSSCYKGGEKLINRLTEEESDYLFNHYEDADRLIDAVQDEVDLKRKEVDLPFEFIVACARNWSWSVMGGEA